MNLIALRVLAPNPGRRRHVAFPARNRRTTCVTGLALTIGLLSIAAGCSDDNSSATADDRPGVTFTATDTTLTVPDEVPGGFIDITLETEPGESGHHLLIARLDDGVTVDELMGADDEQFFSSITVVGGNGTIAAGEDLAMTLELAPGNYFALDNPQNPEPVIAEFTVVAGATNGEEPRSKGVITMGPGMVIDVPDDFDGVGTWEFVNADTDEAHEAAMIRLTDGNTVADVVDWAQSFDGPPPIDGEFGGMGSLGPGERAWMTLEPATPGEYALVCFIPGNDGVPHVAMGMARQFAVPT